MRNVRYKELKAAESEVVLEYAARLVVGRTVVENAFPDWFEILKGKHIELVLSETVQAANSRAEQRRENTIVRSHPSSERANTPASTARTIPNTHNEMRQNSFGANASAGKSADYDRVDEEDVAYYSSYVNNLKGDPLEMQIPKFENCRLGLIESVHER